VFNANGKDVKNVLTFLFLWLCYSRC